MGWSYSDAAGRTIEALEAYAAHKGWDGSNHISPTAFFEALRVEHDDGAITGEVVSMTTGVGKPARIEGDGRISKMPGLDLKGFIAWAEGQPRWQAAARAQAPAGAPRRRTPTIA